MTLAIVLALLALLPSTRAAECPACLLRSDIPRTACLARFASVAGTRAPGCRVCCQDGDPSCDADATANGECRFLPSVCLAVEDPALHRCVPENVVRFAVDGETRDPERRVLADGVRALLPASGAACAAATPITVRLAPRAARSRTVLRTRAWGAASSRSDRDRLVLECTRGPCAAARAGAAVLCSEATPAPGDTRSLEDRLLLAAADARIRQLRRDTLAVRIVRGDGAPRAWARVEAMQLARAFPFGTAVGRMSAVADDPRYLGLVGRLFNTVVTENSLKWAEMEPVEGVVDDADPEAWLAWAPAHGMHVKGAALVWGAAQGVPPWLAGRPPGDARAALLRHVGDTVGRFRGRVAVWDVVNEPVAEPYWGDLLGPDYVVDVIRTARAADPAATLVLNEYYPYTTRAALLDRVDGFVAFVREHVLAAGVAPDAIGFEGHAAERPLEWTEAALDRVAQLGLPIHVTEFDAVTAGADAQADTYEGFLRLVFGHPAVSAIALWGFDDGHHWLGDFGAGIFAADYRPKPAARAVLSLLDERWRTHTWGIADADGVVRFTGFPGRYQIAVAGTTHEAELGGGSMAVVEAP